jgi:hypothetical protein
MHTPARDAGYGLISVIAAQCLFERVALNAKTGVGASVEERRHRASDADPRLVGIDLDQRGAKIGSQTAHERRGAADQEKR